MPLKEYRFDIETDADGDGSATTESGVLGALFHLYVDEDTLGDNWNLDITYENTLGDDITLVDLDTQSADVNIPPRTQVYNYQGTALTLDGTRIAFDMALIAGPVTATISSGGATKACTVLLYVFE